ncbi:MAG: cobalt-precorrin 5A hydrolase [Ascidiaceihabitans sp.]|jgi:cobalt-precorrin 5A hydrolase
MIVAGFGFNSKATPDSLADALDATGYATTVSVLATPQDKVLAPVILDFAKSRGLLILPIPPHTLQAVQTKTQSVVSRLMRRTGSVAEAAALAAAGPHATLRTTRKISNDRTATCAIAKGATP